jgi:DNA-binding CsgD family transcriptional regulator
LRRKLGDRPGIGVSLRGLADVARQRRQDSRARSLYAESIEIALDVGDLPGIAACLEGLAAITVRHQRPEWAATLLGAAEQARFRMDMAQSSASSQVAEYIATVQASLTPEEFDRAWTAGRERPLDETIGRARTHLIPHAAEPPAGQRAPTSMPAQLSRRERQIAALIARGYDNARIADELTLSKRTIETHVSNILRKLNLDSRVQIVLWATDHAITGDSTA